MAAAEHVAIIASAGAITGVAANDLGFKTTNTLVNFGAGVVVAVASWYFDHDGISDFGIGLGAGYAVASVL